MINSEFPNPFRWLHSISLYGWAMIYLISFLHWWTVVSCFWHTTYSVVNVFWTSFEYLRKLETVVIWINNHEIWLFVLHSCYTLWMMLTKMFPICLYSCSWINVNILKCSIHPLICVMDLGRGPWSWVSIECRRKVPTRFTRKSSPD